MTIFSRFVLLILPPILIMLTILLIFSGKEFSKRTDELTQQSVAANSELMELLSNNPVFREYFEYLRYDLKPESEIRRENILTLFEKTVSPTRQGRHLINYIALYNKDFKPVADAQKKDADSKPPALLRVPASTIPDQIHSEFIDHHHHRMTVAISEDLNANQKLEKGEISGYLVVESILPLEMIGEKERSTFYKNIIVIVISIFLMLGLLILVAAQITKPIKKLAEQTSRIEAGGKLNRFVFRQNPREIRQLGTALNRMLDDIDTAQSELVRARQDVEQTIVERTVELMKSNEALHVEISERCEVEEKLLRSLLEKEVLLKEVHHRVKNNMQVIQSLLNLQARTVADPGVRAMFEESRERINSMSLIHEKLYRSADLAHIDFKEYLQALVQSIASSYSLPGVSTSVEMEPVALDVNIGIPCGLIVNELVSNSFKYAFPEGRKGIITIGINKTGKGEYILTVADNGIGIPTDIDFRNTTSLGLRLVTILTGQIHGTIELSRATGTQFSITFPEPVAEDRVENNG